MDPGVDRLLDPVSSDLLGQTACWKDPMRGPIDQES
jgi:hypothetical protein